jgi:hypothetical protein
VPDRDGAIAEAVPNLACWPFGLSADVFRAFSDGLSGVTHGAPPIARGRSNPFFCAKKGRLEGDEPQYKEEARAHDLHPTRVSLARTESGVLLHSQ